MDLHHVGIVVAKLSEATLLYEKCLGARRLGEVMEDEVQGVRIQLLQANDATILELIEPIPGRESAFHTSGQFHLCYTVPDLDAEMQRLHDFGAVVTHPTIRSQLFGNQRMVFLATHSGQLLELLENSAMERQ